MYELGEAAGRIPPISVYDLGPARSIALARPSVIGFISDAETYRSAGAAVIARMAEGLIVPTCRSTGSPRRMTGWNPAPAPAPCCSIPAPDRAQDAPNA